MWARDRHHRIESMLAAREHVSLENLAAEFGVSRETLRRDVVKLEAEGRLRRVHGGFSRVDGAEPPFQSRVEANADAKRRIGAAAARLVEPGMLIAVDAGTTTLAFAEHLRNIPGLQIITNALGIASAVRAAGGQTEVILLGGRLGRDTPGTYGEITITQLRRFAPQIAFISPVALDAVKGAMNFDLAEAEVARAMVESAGRLVILADHTKFKNQGRVQICACASIDTLVTDRKATRALTEPLLAAGMRELVRV